MAAGGGGCRRFPRPAVHWRLATLTFELACKARILKAIGRTPGASEGLAALVKDVLDQYETVAHIGDAQMVFLMGVTEFYRARTDTKMTIATAERPAAVIAAITIPITSLSSVMGMNVIVNDSAMDTADHPLVDHARHFANASVGL